MSEIPTSKEVAASYSGMVVKARTRELLAAFVAANEDPNKRLITTGTMKVSVAHIHPSHAAQTTEVMSPTRLRRF